MKTLLRKGSLGKVLVSATVAALLNIAVSAQPSPYRHEMTFSAMDRLEIFTDIAEQSLKYTAPAFAGTEEDVEQAVNDLEMFAAEQTSSLRYTSPAETDDMINGRLEMLVSQMMENLEYRAPFYDEFTNTFTDRSVMTTLKPNVRHLVDECATPEVRGMLSRYYK